MKRFAAKLLFQFRVVVNGSPGMRRLCEERIITFESQHARAALVEAKRRGHAAQHDYNNSDDNQVRFQFIGVIELLCLGVECEPDEVWYEIYERVRPMERRRSLLPRPSQLNAIRNHE
jgi:hypothetical protein